MPGLQDTPGDQPIAAYFPGHLTAATAKEAPLFRAPFRCTITSVDWIPDTNVTGTATNFFTLNVRNRTTAGAGTAIPAALAFSAGGVTATAQVPGAITLSGTAADLVLAAGDVITAEKAVTGTGLACPAGTIVVHVKAS